MNFSCGPAHDQKIFEITVPDATRIGVLVSGGIDSALLYYLLLHVKNLTNSKTDIIPLIMLRKEGSKYFASPIVEKINSLFNIQRKPYRIGDNTLPETEQIKSAVVQAFNIFKIEYIFIGAIHNRPEHMIGFDTIEIPELPHVVIPFRKLEKSHVIDIFYQLQIEHLLSFTHSCDQQELTACGECNGCRERSWGFEQIGKSDPIFST